MKRSWIFNKRIHFFLYPMLTSEERQSVLRKHLSEILCIEEAEIVFERRADGKRMLKHPVSPVSFSLSHSKDLFLLAIDPLGDPLGIDLQFQDGDIDFELLARHLYTPDENRNLAHLTGKEKRDRALHYWCLKEAKFKMAGNSLFTDPREISIIQDLGGGYHYAACSAPLAALSASNDPKM